MAQYYWCNHCGKFKHSKQDPNYSHKHKCLKDISVSCKIDGNFGKRAEENSCSCEEHKNDDIKACYVQAAKYKHLLQDELKEQNFDLPEQDEDDEMTDIVADQDTAMIIKRICFDETTNTLFKKLATQPLEKNKTFNLNMMSTTLLPNKTNHKKLENEKGSNVKFTKVSDTNLSCTPYKYETVHINNFPKYQDFIQ
eukprot:187998_1